MGTTTGTYNELKNSVWGTYRLKTEEKRRTNDECRRMVENLRVITHGNITETLRKRLGLDFLHGNNFPQQFQENTKC